MLALTQGNGNQQYFCIITEDHFTKQKGIIVQNVRDCDFHKNSMKALSLAERNMSDLEKGLYLYAFSKREMWKSRR
jgi:hypothetical protein